jgi:hypothetical protein
MRVATLAALAATSAIVLALTGPADAQQRSGYRPQTERITIIDENGRVRTKITVRPRSYLDGGTWVLPGERKFMDYANNPTYSWSAPTSAWDPNGIHRFPLPMPFELPNYNPYTNY